MTAVLLAMDEDPGESPAVRAARENLKQWKREVQCAVNLAELLAPYVNKQVTETQFAATVSNCLHMLIHAA
jgi:hypothetical protein